MKNKGIISPVLVMESLKKNIYIPIIATAIYFISGPLIKMMMMKMDQGDFIRFTAAGINPASYLLLIGLPLVSSVSSMDFMHKKVKAMNLMSMPFSRTKIFLSNILAGWLLCISALTVDYIMLLLCDMESAAVVLSGFCYMVFAMTFIFGLFTLAGALVGTTVKHVLLSGILFFLVPTIVGTGIGYADTFIYGFVEPNEWIYDLMKYSNPAFEIFANGIVNNDYEFYNLPAGLLYFVGGAAMAAVSAILFNREKLENIGKSIAFRPFEDILTWFIAFIGASCFGFMLYAVIVTKASMMIGVTLGALISFAVMKIIIEKSVKIFSKRNLISASAFCLALFVFSAVTVFDITGYTNRIPDKNKIEYVQVSGSDLSDEATQFFGFLAFYEPESIETILKMHSFAAKDEDSESSEIVETGYTYLSLTYYFDNGKTMKRDFNFAITEEYSDLVDELKSSKEYMAKSRLANNIRIEEISSVQIRATSYMNYSSGYQEEQITVSDPETIEKIIALIDLNKNDGRREEYMVTGDLSLYIELYNATPAGSKSIYITVTADDTELLDYILKLLEENGKAEIAGNLRDDGSNGQQGQVVIRKN